MAPPIVKDNPKPFIEYTDDNPPKPILKGLTEEIISTGNLKELQKFYKKNQRKMSKKEREYMRARIASAEEFERLHNKAVSELMDGKIHPVPEADNTNGFIGFSDLKGDGIQTCGNGCWSYSYAILLKSRGVNISQEKIRAWRPDYSKDTATAKEKADQKAKKDSTSWRMNTDKGNSVFDNADIMTELLPNTAMTQVSIAPFSSEVIFVDGAPVSAEDAKKIKDYHTQQVAKKLQETITKAIIEDHSPLSITWDGHYVTITGISEDGQTIRYEDSQQAKAEERTRTISLKDLVNLGMTPHYRGGRIYAPTGFNISWLHDLNVPENEKKAEERTILHEKEEGLVQVDEKGNVKVDVPLNHTTASSFGNGANGMILGKGINEQITFDMKEISKLLGGKKVTGIGPGEAYTFVEEENYYPKRVYYLNDPELEKEVLLSSAVSTAITQLSESFTSVSRQARIDGIEEPWIDELREMNKALSAISDYQENPEDADLAAAVPDALKKIKTLPDFLGKKVDGQTIYKHIEELIAIPYRPDFLKEVQQIDGVFNLGIDIEKVAGASNSNDIEIDEYQKMRWNSMSQDAREPDKENRIQQLAGILATEDYVADRKAEGDIHPAYNEVEINSRIAKIRNSEVFRRMIANDGDIELSKLNSTKALLEKRAEVEEIVKAEQIEKNAERSRIAYEINKNQMLKDHEAGFKTFVDVFGPNGKLPDTISASNAADYSGVKLESVKGLTDEMISAIVIGAIMDAEVMKTASMTRDDRVVAENQRKLVDDILNGKEVSDDYVRAMVRGRENAKKAIEAYKAGNQKPVKGLLTNFANYAAQSVSRSTVLSGAADTDLNVSKMAYKFCQDVVINGKFKVQPDNRKVTDIEAMKLQVFSKEIEAHQKAEAAKLNLIKNFGVIKGNQRQELLKNMILDTFISGISYAEEERRVRLACENQEKAFKYIGIDEKHPQWDETGLARSGKVFEASISHGLNAEHKYAISDQEVILSDPNGREKLADLYMDAIEDSEIYKNLLKASTKEEMIRGLQALDNGAKKSFGAFDTVKTNDESLDLNDKYLGEYEKEMKAARDGAVEASFGEGLDSEPEYNGLKTLNSDEVKKVSRLVNALYKKIDGNNTWGGSKNNNYTNMLNKLGELRDLTSKLAKSKTGIGEADARKYENLAREVDSLGEKYLINKTDINSKYARNRVAGVKEMRRALRSTLPTIDKAVTDMKMAKTEELFGTKSKTYDSLDSIVNGKSPFYGTKYEAPLSRAISPNKEGYSLGRWAGISASVLALAATGKYSAEDIIDPTKLTAEKAETFDKIATAMKNQSPEDNKYLATVFCEGRKAMNKLLTEQARKVDFASPNVMQNRDFCILQKLVYHLADAEQEIKHCKTDLLPLLQKDDPSIKKWDDVVAMWSPVYGLVEEMDKQKEAAIKLSTETENLDKHATELVSSTIIMKTILKDLADAQKKNPDKDFKDWFDDMKKAEYLLMFSNTVDEAVRPHMRPYKDDPKLLKSLTEEVINGNSFGKIAMNLDVVENKVTIDNFPGKDDVKKMGENGRFLTKSNEALKRLETKVYRNKEEYIMDSAYAIFGQLYRVSGGTLPIDPKTGQHIQLEQHMKSQIKNHAFLEVLNSDKDPGKLKAPKDVAAMARDEKKLMDFINESNKKYHEANKQKELASNKKKSVNKGTNKETNKETQLKK